MEKTVRRRVRHQCTMVGWGLLCYFLVRQILAGLADLIPGASDSVLWYDLLSYVIFYLLSPWILWLFLRHLPRGQAPGLSLSARAFVRTAVTSVGVVYLFNFLTLGIISLLESATGQSTGNLLEDAANTMPTWFYLVLVGLAAPIFEELIFRHLLLDHLRPLGDRCAILLSAGAFALYHLNLYQFLYAFALGVLFAGVVLKTGKIWHSMLLHAVVNLTSYVLSWMTEFVDLTWPALLVVLIILAACAYAVYAIARYARTYRFAPSQYPLSGGGLAGAVLTSAGFWVCLLVCLAVGVLVAFLV